MAYRQKGDLRALTVIAESAYGVPSATGIYGGTPDTITPKDSEETIAVPTAESRGIGAVYRTGLSFGVEAKFKHTTADTTRGTTGWEQWMQRATGVSAGTAATGATSQTIPNFALGFMVASTEGQVYLGCEVDKLTVSAAG